MLIRLAFWALNAWGAKKGFDLLKENMQLKQQMLDNEATIRTLARSYPGQDIQVVEIPTVH